MIAAGIDAAFGLVRGGMALEVAFTARPGAITALVGPSGCGKTTTLNCIAGLDRPDRGRIAIDGCEVFNAGQGVWLPPARRPTGHLPGREGLSAHKSVHDTLLRRRRPGREGGPSPEAIVELLGLADLLPHRSSSLSEGARRRVVLGRALVSGASVLLLDDPLAALDAAASDETTAAILAIHRRLGTTILYACHDPCQAAHITGEMVLMESGRTVAAGPVTDLSQSEAHHARLADLGSVVDARVCGKDLVNELIELRLGGGVVAVPAFPTNIGRVERLRIAPGDVAITLEEPARPDTRNLLAGTVRALVPHGTTQTDVAISCAATTLWARMTIMAADQLGLAPGRPAFARIKGATIATVYR